MPRAAERRFSIACWLAIVMATLVLHATSLTDRYRADRDLDFLSAEERAATHAALDTLGISTSAYALWWLGTYLVLLVVYLVLGWLLVTRGRPIGFATWIACVMPAIASAIYPPDIEVYYAGQPVQQAMARVLTCIGIVGFFTLPTLFPNGRFVPRWTAVIVVPLVAYLTGFIVFDVDVWPTTGLLDAVLTLALFGTFIGSAIWRYRRVSTADERRTTRWVILGFLIGLPSFVAADAMMRNIDDSAKGSAYLIGFSILIQVGFNAPFLAVGTAMAFHRLFDIDVVLGRTLTWVAMTAGVIGTYIAIVTGIGALVPTDDNLALSLLATGIVAVGFQSVRSRVQRVVDRFVFGDRHDPYAVISRLGAQVTGGIGDLLPTLVHVTAESLRLPYVALYLDTAGRLDLATAIGSPVGDATRFPLAWQGRTVGALDVSPRGPGETFNAADRRLLEDLARQIGLAAHAVTLAGDLQESRERLVTSREEERRRLRRDLHDGLGAQLAALTMQASSARSLVRRDADAAEREIDLLRDELRIAIDDIRRLVHGMRPPALDELGLDAALRARLDRLVRSEAARAPSLQVTIAVPTDLPAAVEVAAYRIVEEAVTNVIRHAEAATVKVSLVSHAGSLEITIADDGRGIDAASAGGIGMHSMRERAAELGGRIVLEDASPGTRLHCTLPMGDGR